MMMNSIRTE